MVFACQQDSFRKTFTTRVTSCEKIDVDTYEVICEDTIIFPEGGGQPCDTGFLNDIPVYQVLRKGAEAIHYVKTPVTVGAEVKQSINWDRRLDHMQQHSGQHLITAVINSEYKIDTTSWWLGTDLSHIELDTTKLSQEQIDNIEKLTNEKIADQVPVNVKLYNQGDPTLAEVHTRGLPDDVSGPLRLVEIVGMEDNLCCGTHVTNLIQLQAIKLLYAEKGKKNKTNLVFLSGGRVLKYLSKALLREQKMTALLNNDPGLHVELVEKLQSNLKITSKKLSNALKQLAIHEAKSLMETTPKPNYYFHHCKDGDKEYADTFLRTIKDDGNIIKTLIILTAGDDKGAGNLVIYGEPQRVSDLGPKIADLLGGKGAAHGPKFQAKVSKLGNMRDVTKLVEESFRSLNSEVQA